jgi:hypothetical protein
MVERTFDQSREDLLTVGSCHARRVYGPHRRLGGHRFMVDQSDEPCLLGAELGHDGQAGAAALRAREPAVEVALPELVVEAVVEPVPIRRRGGTGLVPVVAGPALELAGRPVLDQLSARSVRDGTLAVGDILESFRLVSRPADRVDDGRRCPRSSTRTRWPHAVRHFSSCDPAVLEQRFEDHARF